MSESLFVFGNTRWKWVLQGTDPSILSQMRCKCWRVDQAAFLQLGTTEAVGLCRQHGECLSPATACRLRLARWLDVCHVKNIGFFLWLKTAVADALWIGCSVSDLTCALGEQSLDSTVSKSTVELYRIIEDNFSTSSEGNGHEWAVSLKSGSLRFVCVAFKSASSVNQGRCRCCKQLLVCWADSSTRSPKWKKRELCFLKVKIKILWKRSLSATSLWSNDPPLNPLFLGWNCGFSFRQMME